MHLVCHFSFARLAGTTSRWICMQVVREYPRRSRYVRHELLYKATKLSKTRHERWGERHSSPSLNIIHTRAHKRTNAQTHKRTNTHIYTHTHTYTHRHKKKTHTSRAA